MIKLSEIFLLVALVVVGYLYVNKKPELIRTKIVHVNRDSLTKENIKYWIKVARIKHDTIVYKQAMVESGNLACTNCSLDSNNVFGFSNGQRYLTFNHWIESVFYYAWWQNKHYKGGDYYEFLKEIKYASDTNYINNLKK